jgi:transposase
MARSWFGQGRALADQPVAGAMQRLHVELGFGLELDKPHRRPGRRLGDRLRIVVVVLVRLDVGPDILRRHEPYLMSLGRKQTAEMVGTAAGFHRDHTWGEILGEGRDAVRPEAAALDHGALLVQCRQAAAVLPQVDPDHRNSHDQLLSSGCPPSLAAAGWRGGPSHKSGRAQEQDRPDIAARRAEWRAGQWAMNPARLVFVDETGAATNMARRYGRGPRGQRVDGPVPHGHWKSTTLVGGLTTRGFLAPYVTDGPMTGAIFKAWVEQMLAPELRPGDIVIMDNLAAHKVDGIAQAIAARGAELRYLPPYSPDLNPIEQAFAKLKALLRKAAERTVEGLWTMIGLLLDLFPPAECANYLANSGYPRPA